MSIDAELITSSTAHSRQCLQRRSVTASPELWFVQDFVYPPMLEKLFDFVTTAPNLNWHLVSGQENKNRIEVSWEPESAIEEIHTVYDNLTVDLNSAFGRTLKFNGISIWKDGPGYKYGRHIDTDRINLGIQIYLVDGPADLHTKFYFQDQILQSTYKKNHGYIMDNSNKLQHGIETPVPEDYVRYSLYSSWDIVK
jgi:hypothetical protein